MKPKKYIACMLLSVIIISCLCVSPVSAVDTPNELVQFFNEENAPKHNIEFNKVIKDDPKVDDIISILKKEVFNKDIVFNNGLGEIELIAISIIEFDYWKNADIVDFKWLHSFETGLITHALFEIIGENGQNGYMIYDCEREESSSFSAGISPYAQVEDAPALHSFTDKNYYYFYSPMTYGCGVLKDNGFIDIYEIYSLINNDEPSADNVLYNVLFRSNKSEKRKHIKQGLLFPTVMPY